MTYISQFGEAELKPGAPIKVAGDASKVKAYGDGLMATGLTTKDSSVKFHVDTREAGVGPLKVSILGPNNLDIHPEIEHADGLYTYAYTPGEEGQYTITITFCGAKIPDSPYKVDVSDAGTGRRKSRSRTPGREVPTSPPAVCKVSGPGVSKEVFVGVPAEFQVEGVPSNQKLDVNVASPKGSLGSESLFVEKEDDRIYSCMYLPACAGNHKVDVTVNKMGVGSSPYTVKAVAAQPSYLLPWAKGPGVEGMNLSAKKSTWFKVFSGANKTHKDISVVIKGPKNNTIKFTEKKCVSSVKKYTYTPQEAGTYTVIVTIGVGSSTTMLTFYPIVLAASNLCLVWGSGIRSKGIVVGKELEVFVQPLSKATVAASMIQFKIIGKEGEVPFTVEESCGIFVYRYTLKFVGVYTISILFDGQAVDNTPFAINAVDPSKVSITGPGVDGKPIPANQLSQYAIDIKDAGEGEIACVLIPFEGEANQKAIQQYGSEMQPVIKPKAKAMFEVDFTPKVTCQILLFFTFDTIAIPQSPVKLTVASAKVDEATDGSTEIIQLRPEGVKLGNEFEYRINVANVLTDDKISGKIIGPFEEGKIPPKLQTNKVTLKQFKALAGNETVYDPIISEKDKIVSVVFKPKSVGIYLMFVFLGDNLCNQMPYAIYVCDPSKIVIKGVGLDASKSETFDITETLAWTADCKGAGPGKLQAFITGPQGCSKVVNITPAPDSKCFFNVTFVPDIAGSYQMMFAYSGYDLPKKPTLMISDPSKALVASEDRICYVGEEISLTLDLRNAGAGKLTANLEGPAEAPLGFSNNKDGTCNFTFTPTEAGQYHLLVSMGDKPLTEKPMAVTAIDPSKIIVSGPGITGHGARVKLPAKVIIDCRQSGVAPLEVSMSDPHDSSAVLELQSTDQESVFECMYTPTELGYYTVSISFAGKPIIKSPFKVAIAEPKAVKISSLAALFALPNELTSIQCSTDGAGPGVLTAYVEAPDSTVLDAQVKQLDPNTYEVSFPVPKFGVYHGTICYNGNPVCSPLTIVGGTPPKCTVDGPGLKPKIALNRGTFFTVDTSEAGKGSLKTVIKSPEEEDVPIKVSPPEKQVYTISYCPTTVGDYTINVSYDDVPLIGSPFTPTCIDTSLMVPKVVSTVVLLGNPVEFAVSVPEGDENFTVSVDGPEQCAIEPDASHSNYTFTPTKPGVYEILGMYDQLPVSEEPVKVSVIQSDKVSVGGSWITSDVNPAGKPIDVIVDMSESGIAPVEASIHTPLNETVTLELKPKDESNDYLIMGWFTPNDEGDHSLEIKFNDAPLASSPYKCNVSKRDPLPATAEAAVKKQNVLDIFVPSIQPESITAEFLSPDNTVIPIECTVNKIDETCCQLQYTPTEEGIMLANISCDGKPLSEKPLEIAVGDPTKCLVSGPPIEPGKVPAKKPTHVVVDCIDAGPGTPTVKVNGPNDSSIKPTLKEDKPSVYDCCFTPEEVGPHELSVLYGGHDTSESPYKFSVFNPTAVKCSPVEELGDCMHVGDELPLLVDTSEAGEGTFDVNVEGPGECAIEATPNDDGTHTFKLKPEKPGVYKINPTFNGLPVLDEPLTVPFVDKEKVDVSGPGVTGKTAVPGRPAEVVVDMSESGPAPVEGTIASPSGKEKPLRFTPKYDNDDDVLTSSYTPTETGEHQLQIKFDGEPLPDSPFKPVIDVVGGPGVEEAAVGKDNIIDVYAPGINPEQITMEMIGPDEQMIPIPCTVEKIDDDHCQIKFVPTEECVLPANVLCDGKPLNSEPLQIAVGDPTKCLVSGPPIEPGKVPAKKPTHVVVDCIDAGPGTPTIKVNGPNDSSIKPTLKEDKPSVYDCCFTPEEVGPHELSVLYGGHDTSESPYKFSVFNPTAVKCSPVEEIGDCMHVGDELPLLVDTSEAGEGTFDANVEGPGECAIEATPNDDGTHTFKLKPEKPGVYKINPTFNGLPVLDEPLTVPFVDKEKVDVSGPGVTGKTAVPGRPAEVVVDMSESGPAPVEGTITSPSGKEKPLRFTPKYDNDDEVLASSYTPTETGEHQLQIKFDGEPLPDSPFKPVIDVVGGPGVEEAAVGKDNIIDVYAPGINPEQITMEMIGPDEQMIPIPCTVEKIDDDHCQIKFVPTEECVLPANVLCDGKPLNSEPLQIAVGDPTKCLVSGPPIEPGKVPAKKPTHVVVDCIDAGPGTPTVKVNGPNNSSIKPTLKEDKPCVYNCCFTPEEVGPHELSVLYGGNDTKESPYKFSVFNPTAVKCSPVEEVGDCLHVGDELPLLVDTSEAGEGAFDANVEGPGECAIEATPNDDGTHTFKLKPEKPGVYKINPTFNGLPVLEEPLTVPFVDKEKVDVSGPGVTGKTAVPGRPAEVVVDMSESGPAPVEGTIKSPSGKEKPLRFTPKYDNDDEVLTSSYTPTETGEHQLQIKFDGEPLPDSPFKPVIDVVGGPGVEEAAVGEDNIIDVYAPGINPEQITMEMIGPDEQMIPIPCTVEKIDDDHCQIKFVPTEECVLPANVLCDGKPLNSEPLQIAVGDPTKCLVSGPPIEPGKVPAKKPTHVVVDCIDAGPGTPTIKVNGPNDSSIKPTLKEDKPSVYDCCFTPEEVGPHELSVLYGGHDTSESPYKFSVFNPTAVKCSPVEEVGDCLHVGDELPLLVDTSEAGEGTFDANVEGPGECAIEATPNDDGTHTFKLKPEKPGVYKINPTFNGLPVLDEPLTVAFVDKEKVDVSGPGVTGKTAVPGRPAEVVVDMSESGPAPVEGTIKSPSGKEKPLRFTPKYDNDDEVLASSYTPTETGEHQLQIKFDGEPLPDSPFKPVIDVVGGPGVEEAAVDKDNIIDVYAPGINPEQITMEMIGPDEQMIPIPCTVEKIDDDHCQIKFVPTEECVLPANVLCDGKPLNSEPLQIAVGDPTKCLVSGPPIEPGKVPAKKPTHVVVDCIDAGPGTPTIKVNGPNDSSIKPTLKEDKPSVYDCCFTPEEVGPHELSVLYGGHDTSESPYKFSVFNPTAVKCSPVEEIGDCMHVGDELPLLVDTSEAGEGTFDANVEGPGECAIEATPNDDGTHTFKLKPEKPGVYKINPTFNGLPVLEEPLTVPFVDKEKVDVSGPGVTGKAAVPGRPAEVVVDMSESGPAPLEGTITSPSGKEKPLRFTPKYDNDDEVLASSYTPTETGEHQLQIKFDGEPLPDSPFKPVIDVVGGPGVEEAAVDKDNIIDVYAPGINPEQITMEMIGPDEQMIPIPCTVEKIDDDHCQIKFVPTEECVLPANVLCDGKPLNSEPLQIAVGDPTKCLVSGPPIEPGKVPAKKPTHVVVDCIDAGPGTPTIKVNGPNDSSIKPTLKEDKPSVYDCCFTPEEVGPHELSVLYGGHDTSESPYKFSVFNPTAVKCSPVEEVGDCLHVGDELPLLVDTSEAGDGTFDVCAVGPGECAVEPVDNGDGTTTYKLKPTKPGVYKINPTFNGLPVLEEPLTVPFVDKEKVDVSGPGVTGKTAVPGRPAEVVVDMSESGPAPVEGTITSPSGKEKPLRFTPKYDNDEEVLASSYTPTETGEHQLLIKFDGEPLPDSPFKPVIDVVGGPGVEEAAVGEDNIIDVYAPGINPEQITMEMIGPDEQMIPIPCTVEKIDDDHCQIKFVPTEECVLPANVLCDGKPLNSEPLQIAVGDPTKCLVSGPPIEPGKVPAKKPTHVVVDCIDAGPGTPTIKVNGPNDSSIKPTLKEDKPSVYDCCFTPEEVGPHELSVLYGGHDTNESPYKFSVFNPTAVKCSPVEEVGDCLHVGDELPLLVDTSEAGEGTFDANVEGPGECAIEATPNDDGTHTFKLKPEKPGVYKINPTFNGLPVLDEPLTVPFVDKEKVDVSGPGVTGKTAVPGRPAEVVVDMSESGPAPVEGTITSPSGKEKPLRFTPKYDNDDEVLASSYTPTETGEHQLQIKFDGEPLPDSPFKPVIDVVGGPGVEEAAVDKDNIIDVYAPGINPEQITMEMIGPDEQIIPIPCTVEKIDDDHCQIKFVPTEEGVLPANVLCDGKPLNSEPLQIAVGDPTKCLVSGPPIEPGKVPAKKPTHVVVDCIDAGPGTPTIKVNGPNDSSIKPTLKEDKPSIYDCCFTPEEVGPHELSVLYGGHDTSESPYKFSVFNPTAVKCSPVEEVGDCIHVGDELPLLVDTSEAGDGTFDVCAVGPGECAVEPVDNGDGTTTYKLKPTKPGVYKINPTFNGLPVLEEPLTVPFVDKEKVEVSGPGVTGKTAVPGRPAEVVVDMSESGPAPVEGTLTSPSGKEKPLRFEPKYENDEEILATCYTPTETGEHQLQIKFDGEPLPDSPFKPVIDVVGGPGVEEAAVGKDNIIDVYAPGINPEQITMEMIGPDEQMVPIPCTVEKIDDDHCQIKFVPTEEGVLPANVLCDGKPLNNEPLQIAVGEPTKCLVSGAPIEPGNVPIEVSTFITVDCTNAGPGTPTVIVTGPNDSKIRPILKEDKPGVYNCSFTPLHVAEHTLSILYGGHGIVGSPYTFTTFNPGAVKCSIKPGHEICPIGNEVELLANISDAGPGELDFIVTGPSECHPKLKVDKEDKVYSMCVSRGGVYEIIPLFNQCKWNKEPLKLIIVDPDKVILSGPGATAKGVQLGRPADVFVDTSESGPVPIEASLTAPSGKCTPLSFREKVDSNILASSYTPKEKGYHLLRVTSEEKEIASCKVPIKVFAVDPNDFKLEGKDLTSAQLGEPKVIDCYAIDLPDVDKEEFAMFVESEDGEKEPLNNCNIVELEPNHWRIEYVPEAIAVCAILCYNDVPIGGKASINIGESPKCNIIGLDTSKILLINQEKKFTVDLSASVAASGKLKVITTQFDGSRAEANVTLLEKDIYEIAFTPTVVGKLKLLMLYGGGVIGREVFLFYVIDPSTVVCTGLDTENTIDVAETAVFAIDTTAAGSGAEINVEVEGEGNCTVSCKAMTENNYSGSVVAKLAGNYKLHVTYGGVAIPGSPFSMTFGRAEADASQCAVSDFLETPGKFMIDCRNAGGYGMLEIAVYGAYVPTKYIAVTHNGDYTFNVEYDIPDRVETYISVKWHHQELQGSPFKVCFM